VSCQAHAPWAWRTSVKQWVGIGPEHLRSPGVRSLNLRGCVMGLLRTRWASLTLPVFTSRSRSSSRGGIVLVSREVANHAERSDCGQGRLRGEGCVGDRRGPEMATSWIRYGYRGCWTLLVTQADTEKQDGKGSKNWSFSNLSRSGMVVSRNY